MNPPTSRGAAAQRRHPCDARAAHVPEPRAVPVPADDAPLNVRLGYQLRGARQASGLDLEDCAQSLRLPARVLRKLEAGDYSGISEGVYLRNYLTSYGAHVGLPRNLVQAAIAELAPSEVQPTLVSTGGISRSHYLWHRYTTAATYAVLTAVIVVPLVWLGLKGGLDRELTRLEPLSAAPVAQPAATRTAAPRTAGVQAGRARVEQPLMASMAPFSALDRVDANVPVVAEPPPTVVAAAGHTLSITLSEPSWVEVTTQAGKHLEYNLLPAGAHKVFHSDQPLQVSIGDTTAARVELDGRNVDLANFRHANVAHFRVALEDGHALVKPM